MDTAKIRYVKLLVFGLIFGSLHLLTPAQEIHPKKGIYKDKDSWKTTAPGEVKLKNFSPFRAVYDRTYSQGSGPNAGDKRHDRVIITAEETGWDGRRAVAITLIDSGIVEHDDTNARILTMFVDLNDLSVLFEIGPIPGKAKDYYIGRFEKEEISINQIITDTQKHVARKMPTDKPGFGPNAWVMASMNLSKGLKINLSPMYSSQRNPLTPATYGHIISQESFTDGSGKKHKSWVLETGRNLSNPLVAQIYLTDQPPYYLGNETVNLDTGERKKFTWLRSLTMF